MLDRVWPELECRGSARELVAYWFAHDSKRDEDVLAEVDAWRALGRKAFLGTVQEHHRAKYIWETLGLRTHFDGIHYSAALGAKKPDTAFYERSQIKLPVRSPADVVFLDDATGNIEAAAAFGWRTRHFRSVEDLRAALAEAK